MPGTIDIQASITDVSGSLAQLPEAVLQATSLLQQSCAARFGGGKTSSLVVGGKIFRDPSYRVLPGNTLRNEIEARDASRLGEATDVAAEAIAERFKRGAVDGKIQAHIVTIET